MLVSRRRLLAGASGVAGAVLGGRARAGDGGPMGERAIGSPGAPGVAEFFSFTFKECSGFAHDVMPDVRRRLIDTGKIRWVFRDYPTDDESLAAAMVARYAPEADYAAFVDTIFATQDRWADNSDLNHIDELWKVAQAAGMDIVTFDRALRDTALKDWLRRQSDEAQSRYNIGVLPCFAVKDTTFAGDVSYDVLASLVGRALGWNL